MSDIIDINVGETIEEVTINVVDNLITVNINKVTGGGGGTQTLEQTLVLGNTTGGENISISNGDAIILDNGSMLKKGTIDAGNGGSKGISQICGVGFEHKWEAGRLYIMNDGGTIIREVSHNLTYTPTATDDVTKGFVQNTRWILDNGDVYVCTDPTEGAAVWELQITQVNADWDATSGVAEILNKPTIPDTSNLVPYTGANANVDLGEYELKAGQIELDTTPTGTAGVAVTRWNDTLGSTETTLKGGSVILKNGVDLVARVVNKVSPNTTLTKAAYQVVKVSGAQGQRLAVDLARANTDLNSADTLGIVTETIAANQEGFIITVGQLEGINTTGSLQSETWSDGDVLYLSPTTAGRITNVKPNGSTGHIVVLGYVEHAHITQGKIYVKIMNGWELDELHNVYISSVADKQLLSYDSATSLWKNKSVTTADIASSTDKNYVTDAQATVIGNTSGTNTGDETNATIKTKLGAASTSVDGYLTSTDWNTFNQKCYAINLGATSTTYLANNTYYFGIPTFAATTASAQRKILIPKSGIIKGGQIYVRTSVGTTSENWTLSIRLNNASNTTFATVGTTALEKVFGTTSLNIAVVAGDFIEIITSTPAWVTGPGSSFIYGTIIIQ